MSSKFKIAFFCPNLGGGGAEMHLTRLINHLDSESFEVHLINSRPGGDYLQFLHESVKIHFLSDGRIGSGVLDMFKIINPLAKVLKELKPMVFVSVMDHSNLMAHYAHKKARSKAKLVFCVQTPILQSLKFAWKPFNQIVRWMIPLTYTKADKIISLSEGVKADLIRMNHKLAKNIIVINNIGIEKTSILQKGKFQNSKIKKIIVCGRLIKLKGFHDVIAALPKILKYITVELLILGDGPEKNKLEQQSKSLGVDKNVKFLGFQNNPEEFISQADLFVLSSYYEGFGNVIIEAMSLGVPVVATDCPYGPGEIISDGENGLLVPVGSPGILADEILKVLNNADLAQRLSIAGEKSSKKYSGAAIAKQYEECLINTITADL